ncbi:hypothetical protein HS7_11160 [Sulfolobales archaeon HS-7]|nr:hypothetical protein HS7_11160 [Sulfolobales archaeon HS-7]
MVIVETIEFKRIKTGNQFFEDAMKIYVNSFPPAERQKPEVISSRVDSDKEELYIGTMRNNVISIALVWPLLWDFALVDYVAVKEGFRGKGIGTATIRFLSSLGKRLLFEVEDPANGSEERKLRVEFYKKNGAKVLKGVKYILPPLSGDIPTDMILMVIQREDVISGEIVRRLVIQIYEEVYSLNTTNKYVAYTLNTIPSIVTLE